MPKSSTSPKTSGKAEIRPARIAKALLAEMEKDRAEQERISRRTEKIRASSDGNYNQSIGGILPFPFRRRKPQGNVLKLDSPSPMAKPVDSGIDDGEDGSRIPSGRGGYSGPEEIEGTDLDEADEQEPSVPADDVISQAEELRRDRQEAQAREQDNPDETDEAYGDWGGNVMGRDMEEMQSMAEGYGDDTDETDDAYGDWDGNVSGNNINQEQNQDRNSQAQNMAMQMAKKYAKEYVKKAVVGWLIGIFIAALPVIIKVLVILLLLVFICIIGYYAYNHPYTAGWHAYWGNFDTILKNAFSSLGK